MTAENKDRGNIISGSVKLEEKKLVEDAAKIERRTLSSFVAIASIERATRILKEAE